MKRGQKDKAQDLVEEYDFTKGIRGKYAKRYAEGSNIVVVDPDLIEFFPTQVDVNRALRSLVEVIRSYRGHSPHPS